MPHAPRERPMHVRLGLHKRVSGSEHATIEAHCVLAVGREEGEHCWVVAWVENCSARGPYGLNSTSTCPSPG
jgi:hypothetical protein